ncbi:VanZ family protein [Azoarcus olearius]|uniref:VanZ family protein n=1 Tax=Azoarcus sp. (strain BH72) TaxID=418699 RepID=UPI0002FB2324|nr:VanZ family protein [Azoarcus olearius]
MTTFSSSSSLRLALRAAFALALIVVFWLAVQPAPDIVQLFSWQDKAEHALLFAALAALGFAAWPQRAAAVVVGLLAYGAAMEVAQSFTAFRVGDPWDWLADAVGTLAALPLRRRC